MAGCLGLRSSRMDIEQGGVKASTILGRPFLLHA